MKPTKKLFKKTKTPLTGIRPKDGDIIDLSAHDMNIIAPKALKAARKEKLGGFWATFPEDKDAPSIVVDGVGWDLMAGETGPNVDPEDVPPYVWTEGRWVDISRF